MKEEHKLILNLLQSFRKKSKPKIWTGTFNLGVNEFQETTDPRNPNYNIRDIQIDKFGFSQKNGLLLSSQKIQNLSRP
ncbi:hypothetical protein JOD96_003468 [Flavobacterium sp. 1355]|nr:hypothetical protein [Flavobacterium sp. 1355]